MANNRLILRTVNSPWLTTIPDLTKGSVLTHVELDNNFIYLKGEVIEDITITDGITTFHKVNGNNISYDNDQNNLIEARVYFLDSTPTGDTITKQVNNDPNGLIISDKTNYLLRAKQGTLDLIYAFASGKGHWGVKSGGDEVFDSDFILINSTTISPWENGSALYSIQAINDSGISATDFYAVAEGYNTTASGYASHAEGFQTTASGIISHAEGNATQASGDNSHAEGQNTIASGQASHAEGGGNTASGSYSHAEGQNTIASGDYSHSEGRTTVARDNYSHAEGFGTLASGTGSHAEGNNTTASGIFSHAQGGNTIASGTFSHVQGVRTTASGNYSHAEGKDTESSGENSHAGGKGFNISNNILADGATSFVHYEQTSASGNIGAFGDNSVILGGTDHNIAINANNSAILGGDGNNINASVTNSAIIGGTGITATQSNTTYIPNLNITDIEEEFSGNTSLTIDNQGNVKKFETNNFSRTLFIDSDDLDGCVTCSGSTLEEKIVQYVNSLNYNKTSVDTDIWIEFLDVGGIFTDEFDEQFE